MRRIVLLLLVALALAPGTWVRTRQVISTDERQLLSATPLPLPQTGRNDLRVAGAWELDSPNGLFGGYSAMAMLTDGTLLAVSDKGRKLRFTPPDRHGNLVQFGFVAADRDAPKDRADVEGLTFDPVSGMLWAAYEGSNMIVRHDVWLLGKDIVRPEAMRDWPDNKGPETILRLADGRFIVLAEGSTGWFDDDYPALLFPSDPVAGATPERFRFRPPQGYRPVDAAQLADGRVLVLLRSTYWSLPPAFAGKLLLADPAAIRPDEPWEGEELADLAAPLPTDNYEGIAVETEKDGTVVLWLISDDNDSSFQRTLLLKLIWRPNEKARGTSRAPS